MADTKDRDWKPSSELPRNSPKALYINARTVEINSYRWLLYKPTSAEFKRGLKGRWQIATEFGWKNAPLPPESDWTPLEDASLSKESAA